MIGYDSYVVVVTETLLNPMIRDDGAIPSGYNISRKDREESSGAGVKITAKTLPGMYRNPGCLGYRKHMIQD